MQLQPSPPIIVAARPARRTRSAEAHSRRPTPMQTRTTRETFSLTATVGTRKGMASSEALLLPTTSLRSLVSPWMEETGMTATMRSSSVLGKSQREITLSTRVSSSSSFQTIASSIRSRKEAALLTHTHLFCPPLLTILSSIRASVET